MDECEFCKCSTNKDILERELPVPGVSEYVIRMRDDYIETSATDFIGNTLYRDRVKINFCPFCGRKFDEEVVEEKPARKISKIFRRREHV